jgi:hypothetical protein
LQRALSAYASRRTPIALGRLAAFKTMVVYYQLLQSFVQRT